MIFYGPSQSGPWDYHHDNIDQLFLGIVEFRGALTYKNVPTSDPGVADRVWVRNGKLQLSGATVEPVVRSLSHENPGSYPNWELIPDAATVLSIEQAQQCRRRLPQNPHDGQRLTIIFPLATGALSLHTGAFSDRRFYYYSTGRASNYQVNLNAPADGGMYTCVYVAATNKWFLK